MAIKKPQVLSSPSSASSPVQIPADIPGMAAAQMLNEVKAEVSPEAAPLWNFVLGHAKQLTLAVLLLIVVILAAAGWQWHSQNQVQEAKLELGRISATSDPAARYAALQGFAAKAPAEISRAVRLELASTAAALEKWDEAAQAYGQIAREDQGKELSPLAVTAWLNRIDLLLRQGKAKDAVAEMEEMLPRVPAAVKPLTLAQLGSAAELAGDKARAVSAYEEFIKALPPADSAQAGYYKARIAALK